VTDPRLSIPAVPVDIRRAAASDAAWIAQLIATAFHPLAVARWLVPDPARRTQVLTGDFRIWVEHAFPYGVVYATTDLAAVAVWFLRDADPPPEPAQYLPRLAAACGDATVRFQALDALFERRHPTHPHHHLAFLAVHPDRQGQGLGSALLRRHHGLIDSRGVACYLEATSQRARDLYARHGYQVMGTPFYLPDSTPIWPMWRTARTVRLA
jgi:ribosomal protein S18 acetylase RimI-like enzyme